MSDVDTYLITKIFVDYRLGNIYVLYQKPGALIQLCYWSLISPCLAQNILLVKSFLDSLKGTAKKCGCRKY